MHPSHSNNLTVTPYAHLPSGKKEQVEKMFDEIAFRYDFLNQLLSFGIHTYWRRKAIRLIAKNESNKNANLLDMATGTADFAIEALSLNPQKVTGIDISKDMLEAGKRKLEKRKATSAITLLQADCQALPFPNNHFDAATVGFGIRNFENLEQGLKEASRVLKKGAPLIILEFSIPQKFPIKQWYHFYLKNICPIIGRLISKNPVAYEYLFKSIQNFPYGTHLQSILLNCGFSQVKFHPQTLGIVTIYIATK
jgi:demethylmenaquinone methyltransferase/2-methoxy-6-polyprenyl-1,4-benzoquinol methylase